MTSHRAAAVRREYASLASTYEDRWARYVAATTARTLTHLAMQSGEALLDLGCGTGALLRAVAASTAAPSLVGVDVSLPMLQSARSRLERDVALIVADVAALPVDSGSIDAVVSVSSFHYWPDPAGGLREIGRALRPGGRLVITDWCDDFVGCKLLDRWLRLTRRAYHRIYGARECTALVARAGFKLQRVERYKVSWPWGMMTLAAQRQPV